MLSLGLISTKIIAGSSHPLRSSRYPRHSLEMKVIAEGVETAEQMEILKLMDCDEMQGYYLGRPMPASSFSELLKKKFAE